MFSEVIYQNPEYRNTSFNMFFITKARVFCIFVVIRGEGQSLESLWMHPTHRSYVRPVRPFLANLQAVRSCLRPVRTLHNMKCAELCEVYFCIKEWIRSFDPFLLKITFI